MGTKAEGQAPAWPSALVFTGAVAVAYVSGVFDINIAVSAYRAQTTLGRAIDSLSPWHSADITSEKIPHGRLGWSLRTQSN